MEEPEENTTSYVANVDFNNLPAGTKDAPTKYVSRTTIGNIDIRPGGSTANIQVFPHDYDNDTDKYIAVNSVSGSTPPFVDIATDYAQGSVIVTEFRMRLGDNFAINGPFVKVVQNSPVASIHLIRIKSDGTLANAVNGTSTSAVLKTPEGADVMVDKFEWTTVKIVADFANNTKDIYIDGVLCLENAKIKANVSEASGFKVDLTRLSQLDPNATGTVYIDDFKSYYQPIANVTFEDIAAQDITSVKTLGDVYFSATSAKTPMAVIKDGDNSYASVTSIVTGNSNGYIDIATASAAGKDLTVEGKFKIGKYGQNDYALCGNLFKLLDANSRTIALVGLAKDGGLHDYVYTTSSDYPTAGSSFGVSLSENEWTTVKVVCHFSTNTKDVYVNGTCVAEGVALYRTDRASTYTPAKMRIMHLVNSGLGTLYIDDYVSYN